MASRATPGLAGREGLTSLRRVAGALVRLEAFARQEGHEELAALIDAAACHADALLTGGGEAPG